MLLLLLRRRVCVGGCYARVAWNEPILSTETFQVYLNLISIWLKEIQSTRYSVYYVWFVYDVASMALKCVKRAGSFPTASMTFHRYRTLYLVYKSFYLLFTRKKCLVQSDAFHHRLQYSSVVCRKRFSFRKRAIKHVKSIIMKRLINQSEPVH